MRVFWKLDVGLRAHALTREVYQETRAFPEDERFALTAQIRRAAYSIGANIAEGCGRRTDRDFARFLDMALGSASELEYLCLLARDLGYLEPAMHRRLRDHILDVKRMLHGLARAVRGP
ncbi:MAG: four helix bundle protein [Gemmatimonadota bacterium]